MPETVEERLAALTAALQALKNRNADLEGRFSQMLEDRRWHDARRPLRHGEMAHAGYIGEERNLKFDISGGHDHDGVDSKLISVPAAFSCSDLGACSIAALGTKDHDLLGGLADDDHTLYALASKARPAAWVEAGDLAARSIADLGTRAHSDLTGVGTNTHDQIDSKLGYALRLSAPSGITPADATTYYTAAYGALSTVQGRIPTYIPLAGTVVAIYGSFYQTAGSPEASTLSLLLNGTTDTVISSTLTHNAATTVFSKTGMTQAVVAGDYFECKWITPTWVNNPSSVMFHATVWVAT